MQDHRRHKCLRTFCTIGLVAVFGICGDALATCPAAWDLVPGDPGTNGTVYCLLPWDAGSGMTMIAGGQFGGLTQTYLASWNGQQWAVFAAGLNGPVTALAAYDEGGGSGWCGARSAEDDGASVGWEL